METAAKDQLFTGAWSSILRKRTNVIMTILALVMLYFLGAGIAFAVCTRTFVSFRIFFSESQAPVLLPGYEESVSAPEVLKVQLQTPAHTLRDVRSIADSWSYSPVESFGEGHDGDAAAAAATAAAANESDEPQFMQQPELRVSSVIEAANLQARLKRMTSWQRRQSIAKHWNSFQIFKNNSLSQHFEDQMQQFFCSIQDQHSSNVEAKHSMAVSKMDQMDEKKICGTCVLKNGTCPTSKLFCRQRFILTWTSPVSSFGPRERLTLESIFKWHPHSCVVVLSQTLDSSTGRTILEPIVARGHRVRAVTPDLASLFANTPAAKWFQQLRDGAGDPGCINLMQNLSNVMRLAALYKYGGIYVDTDVIILKPVDELRNVVGAQSQNETTGRWTRLNNAVLVFDREHPVVLEFLQEFADTFDGNRWGWNGPYMVSRVVEKLMQRPNRSSVVSVVSVLPPQAFYPVNWTDIVHLFHRPADEGQSKWQAEKLEWIQQGSYAIHLWNKKSNFLKVEHGSIIETLFKQSCLFCKVSRPPTLAASARHVPLRTDFIQYNTTGFKP